MEILKIRKCALAILCMSPLLYSCDSGNNNEDNIDRLPVKLSQNGNWSMIDSKGNVVYDGEFKNKPTVAYNGYFSVEEGDGYTLYKIGENKPIPVKGIEEVKEIGYMEEDLIPVVKKNTRIQLVNGNGETKFTLEPIKGMEIVECEPGFKDGLLLFKTEDDKYGYYGTDGKVAIEPKYTYAFNFSEGMAIVGKESSDSTSYSIDYEVINKKGETIFKIKEGYNLRNDHYNSGYLLASNGDRLILFDKKGEITKLPTKINHVVDYNEKYLIFINNEGSFGVADIKGEIVIRPKYNSMAFKNDESFFAVKNGESNEIICLNSKGEEEGKSLDYSHIEKFGKFGYLAKDGETTILLDQDFKAKGKEEFYQVEYSLSSVRSITSDYFNPATVAKIMVSMCNGDKVGNYILNGNAQTNLKDQEPSSYTYTDKASLTDLDKTGFRYKINAKGQFSETIATADYSNYSSTYIWNSNSKLAWVSVVMECESEWGENGQKELVDALVNKGFKVIKTGTDESGDGFITVTKKGNVYGVALSHKDAIEGVIIFATDKIPEVVEYLINPFLKQINGAEEKVPETPEATGSDDISAADNNATVDAE